jgi:hypothetical protein
MGRALLDTSPMVPDVTLLLLIKRYVPTISTSAAKVSCGTQMSAANNTTLCMISSPPFGMSGRPKRPPPPRPGFKVAAGRKLRRGFQENPRKYQVIKMRAKHGGFRKGAGRPKGSKNRSTIAREARQREALAADREANASLMPVDYLLQVMRDPTTAPGRRARAAMFVAPYLEARMALWRKR